MDGVRLVRSVKMRLVMAAAAALVLGASACVTQPKPCTAEWVDWKTGQFLDRFASEHRDDLVSIKETTSRLTGADDKSIGNMTTMAMAGIKVIGVAGSFLSDTVPEIKDALGQCGTAPRASKLFASLLRRQGFDERAVKAIEDLGAFIGKDA
jgi:hypothetical protein